MEGILEPEKLAEAERKCGMTLKRAAEIMQDIRKRSESTDPFEPLERDAIIFLGAAWKCGYITKALFLKLYGAPEN